MKWKDKQTNKQTYSHTKYEKQKKETKISTHDSRWKDTTNQKLRIQQKTKIHKNRQTDVDDQLESKERKERK